MKWLVVASVLGRVQVWSLLGSVLEVALVPVPVL